jgi:matrix metalloproteinase-14 (membrane-inserted)
MYLMKYGYMDAPHPGSKSANLLSRDGLKEYIMEFQAFGGLNMTGELDKETIALMSMPRYWLRTLIKKKFLKYKDIQNAWSSCKVIYG